MTSHKEMSRINKLVEVIEKAGTISRVQLVMNSGISNSYYEKLKPYLEAYYPYKVRYDKETKTWYALKQEQVPE